MTTAPVSSEIQSAFAELSAMGYLAMMNFSCCQNCAGYELTIIAGDAIRGGRPKESILGCVFWHAQDEENRLEDGAFHLSHGPMKHSDLGTIGKSPEAIAADVVRVLKKNEINVEWDGDVGHRILVKEQPYDR